MNQRLPIMVMLLVFSVFTSLATVHNVSVSSSQFSPSSLTITAGDTVLWTNTGGSHNVNGTTTTFASNPESFGNSVGSGWTFQHQFTVPGTYDYQCDLHAPGMAGQVVVNAAPSADMIITGVFDADLPGGLPKGVELYVVNNIADLSSYGLGSANNGGGSDGQEFTFPADPATANSYIYVTTDSAAFYDWFGFDADYIENSASNVNGDDAIELFSNSAVIDVFGDINTDGSGTAWEYADGWAYRNNNTGPDGTTFMLSNWTFGNGDFDTYTSNSAATNPMPIGTYNMGAANPGAPCSQPFFSEYIEGSSNNKGFEIYNPTSGNLDLGPYKVILSGNGGSFTNEFNPTATIASGDVYVITTDQSDPTMLAQADTALSYPSVAHFNGDDALFLVDTVNNDTIDIIGIIGVDPGSSWTVDTGATANYTLVRKSTVDAGQTDWSIGANEWDVHPQDTFSLLGAHTSGCVSSPVASCSQPYFSEYIEGSSNNKGFEIYNPTSGNLNLDPYKVYLSGNGGSFTNEFNPVGTIASGDVYVITTDQSDPTMLAQADTALSYPSVAHFNGDDALFLVDTVNNDTLDIVGVIGVDPGSSWTVGSGATAEYTLVRNQSVVSGQTDWSVGATEWTVYPQNTYTHLGSHSSTCINAPSGPTINFATAAVTANEGDGTVSVNLLINPVSSSAETVDLQFALGSGISVPADGSISPLPALTTGILQLSIPANEDSVSFDITLVDDAVIEGNETLFVSISAVSSGLTIGSIDDMIFVVEDNDYPTLEIDSITTVDNNGIAVLEGRTVMTHGVVFTDDYDGNNGYSFYIYDNTGGINIYNFTDVDNYQATRGDSIFVRGEVETFNGLTEIFVDSIAVLKTGVALKNPTIVGLLDESAESEYIRMNNMEIVDATQWTNAGSGFNVDITNGVDTVVMRIDADIDLYNAPAPVGTFDVIGVGTQYDPSSPHFDGYQIMPRDANDIIQEFAKLAITEVMPSSNQNTMDGDWFELYNYGNDTIDLQGYSWDDNSNNPGAHTFGSFSIAPGEYVIVLDEVQPDDTTWLNMWMQRSNGLRVITKDMFGPIGFSGLSSTDDTLYLYNDAGAAINMVYWEAGDVTAGFSLQYDTLGMLQGGSQIGANGAYASTGGDVGNPGNMQPISIDEFSFADVKLYPNPATDVVYIEVKERGDVGIRLSSIDGQLVRELKLSAAGTMEVSTADLTPGLYMLTIEADGQSTSVKVVIR